MEICKKNWSKVRALYALRLRKLAGAEWAGAGEIADMAGVNRDSLYVLLHRWRRWELVKCNVFAAPLRYAIACRGNRYLNQLPKWYGPHDVAYQVVCEASRPSLFWRQMDRYSGQVVAIHFLLYPFKTAADYQLVRPDAAGRLIYQGDSLIRIEKGKAIEAFRGIYYDLGLSCSNELMDFLVSSNLGIQRKGGAGGSS